MQVALWERYLNALRMEFVPDSQKNAMESALVLAALPHLEVIALTRA